jgi:hypothetical protein
MEEGVIGAMLVDSKKKKAWMKFCSILIAIFFTTKNMFLCNSRGPDETIDLLTVFGRIKKIGIVRVGWRGL